jgi:hypothetical protein
MEPSPSAATEPREAETIPVVSEHIISTPDTCGGAPRIADSRIRVKDVVIWHVHQGMSPDVIVLRRTQTRRSPPACVATAST